MHSQGSRFGSAIALISLMLLPAPSSGAPDETWQLRYSTGVTLHTSANGAEFHFEFPRRPGSVHYLTKMIDRPPAKFIRATFTIHATQETTFDFHTAPDNTCAAPSSVRLFFQRAGDDMSGEGHYEFYRWWATRGTVLKAGHFDVEIPLEPSLWTSVFGKTGAENKQAFGDARQNLGAVGVTFGGGCFYGHGVWLLRGQADFTMETFDVK